MKRAALYSVLALASAFCAPAYAVDLPIVAPWAAMTSDRLASRVGDSLTVLVYESASATNTAQSGNSRGAQVGGQLSHSSSVDRAELSLNGKFDAVGQSEQTDRLVGQVSVVVEEVRQNGDLHVAGEQLRKVNGQTTRIRVEGVVRPADITSANTVLSARLADAVIEYSGRGNVSRSARPGLISRAINGLRLF